MDNTILIVDDDPQVRTLCRITLEGPRFCVREASNGKEALAAVEETACDLILLDLCMPDMDGFEFMRTVRAKLPKLKIICMSGFMNGTMLPAAGLCGAAATLGKPFPPASLFSIVCEVLSEECPGPVSA
ncbi:MAG TPA: response regulator [Bryobacteraceae bacterium]|nr:response regulator [Bryobacteraceae bacterium]